MTRIAITGAGGRMGRRIAELAVQSKQFELVAAMETPGHEVLGRDVGELIGVGRLGVAVADRLTGNPEVLIDFSLPEGTMQYLPACRERGVGMVIGTTGLPESATSAISEAARAIPIVHAANMSVGVNVLLRVIGQVAKALGADYDIEVTEAHHRFKKDAPSGTAIALTKAVCAALGKEYGETVVFGRGGQCPRKPGEIGMHALRIGDTVGEHTVSFGNLGETVAISHSAHTRDTFVNGALRAARWLAGRTPGLYNMQDVLFGDKA